MRSFKGVSLIAIAIGIAAAIAVAALVALESGSSTVAPMPDAQYISIASTTPEAQLFLASYPGATPSVDRSGALAVDFRPSGRSTTDPLPAPDSVRLRVFVDPGTGRPRGFLFDCGGKVIEDRVMSYLRESIAIRGCP